VTETDKIKIQLYECEGGGVIIIDFKMSLIKHRLDHIRVTEDRLDEGVEV
jgi:hypothetical protein